MDEMSFEQRVKIALIKREMSQKQLCEAVTERTGLYCDYSLLRKIFTGQMPGNNVRKAVCEILDISATAS